MKSPLYFRGRKFRPPVPAIFGLDNLRVMTRLITTELVRKVNSAVLTFPRPNASSVSLCERNRRLLRRKSDRAEVPRLAAWNVCSDFEIRTSHSRSIGASKGCAGFRWGTFCAFLV